MISENIKQYLASQNFALTAANGSDICILKNRTEERGIFCVVINNTGSVPWSASQISSINAQLKESSAAGYNGGNDVLFIVVTEDPDRDKSLAKMAGVTLWLADSSSSRLIIYEDQREDFYGLREGIEAAITKENDQGQSLKNNFPFATAALIALNVLYFIVLSLNGNPQSASYMISMGANFAPYVFTDLQVWRLVTSMFMHFGLFHLAGNMIYLAILGYQLEHTLGKGRFLLIYMMSGTGSALVSAGYYYIAGINTVSAGASGAIYGLIAVYIYFTVLAAKRTKQSSLFLRAGIGLVFIFYTSFLGSNVDGAAHVGGFLFGIILCMLFVRGGKRSSSERRRNDH